MKQKLFAAALMLTLSAVMLVSTSFAWYTISRRPTVSRIETSIRATQNIEISSGRLDGMTLKEPYEVTLGNAAYKNAAWGSTISGLSGVQVNYPAMAEKVEEDRPTDVASYRLVTAGFDKNGHIGDPVVPEVGDYTVSEANNSIMGFCLSSSVPGSPVRDLKSATVIPVWLRTNTDMEYFGLTIDKSKTVFVMPTAEGVTLLAQTQEQADEYISNNNPAWASGNYNVKLPSEWSVPEREEGELLGEYMDRLSVSRSSNDAYERMASMMEVMVMEPAEDGSAGALYSADHVPIPLKAGEPQLFYVVVFFRGDSQKVDEVMIEDDNGEPMTVDIEYTGFNASDIAYGVKVDNLVMNLIDTGHHD